jgi:hypothetical protein
VFSVLLCLPRLGAFGLWEPWELNLADRARRMADGGFLTDPSVGGALPRAKPLGPMLQTLGIKVFGANELGVRLGGALSAVGALMAIYWAGCGLLRRRAALLAVLAMGTTPLFALSARQLTSDMPLVAALALALGGLGRFAWPPDGKRRWRDAAIAAGAMGAGYLAGGALTGVALPALAVIGAVIVCARLTVGETGAESERGDGTAPLASAGVGPDLPAGRSLAAATLRPGARGFPLLALVALAAVVALVASMVGVVAGRYSVLLGGTPRGGPASVTFEHLARGLGFGLYPWSALAIFALGRPLIRLDDDPGTGLRTNSRLAFSQTYLLLFAAIGFALSTYLLFVLGEARYVALPAIALAIGAFLDEALEAKDVEPVTGLLVATGTLVVARDFFLAPEELASVHLLSEKVRWPGSVTVAYPLLGFGLLVALGMYAGLAARARARREGPSPREARADAPAWRRRIDAGIVAAGRYGIQVAVGATVVFGFWLTQVVIPRLSTHLSFKPAMESYARYARGGEKIGRYRVEIRSSGFYGARSMIDLPSQERVVGFLRAPERVFALVSADELAPLDTALKLGGVPYFAIDASSSRFLLLSNRIGAGESDQNPLRKNVWMAPTDPQKNGGQWNPAERPPWSWRIPLAATFGDAIEIVGAEYPESIRRPGKIPLELYFRVKARPPGGHKIFVHFDGPASPRVIGDHDPVGKAFGTMHWIPGEYIRDVYEVDVPLMTTPAGTYHIYMGFWPGGDGKRLKITEGPNDGSDRLRVGTIEVK